jgi:hypothetical protein
MSSAIGEFAALSSAQRSAQADKSKNEIRDAWLLTKRALKKHGRAETVSFSSLSKRAIAELQMRTQTIS